MKGGFVAFSIRRACAETWLILFVSLLSTGARANESKALKDYVDSAVAIIRDTMSGHRDFESRTGKPEDWMAGAKARLVDIKALDVKFKDAVEETLKRLTPGSPAYRWATDLRKDIANTFKDVDSTHIRASGPIAKIDEHKDGFYLEDVDPFAIQLVHFNILRGFVGPPVDLLQLFAVNVSIQFSYLLNLDIVSTVERDRPRLIWEEYVMAYEHTLYSLYVLRTFFPMIPDATFGQMSAIDKDDDAFRGLSKRAYTPVKEYIFSGFQTAEEQLAALVKSAEAAPDRAAVVREVNAARDRLTRAKETMETTLKQALWYVMKGVEGVEDYRRRFYPVLQNDAEMDFLADSIYQVPGVHSCLGIAKGVGDFTGPPCDFRAFKKALIDFITYHSKIADHGVMWLAVQHIRDFLEGKLGEGDAGFNELKRRFLAIQVSSAVNPNIREVWPNVVNFLFAKEPPRDAPPGFKTVRQLLEEENPSALKIFMSLKSVFLHKDVGIGVCRNGNAIFRRVDEGMAICGTSNDFLPSVAAIEDILKGFQHNVERVIEGSVLPGENTEQRLNSLSSRVGYVDASRHSCDIYTEKSDPDKKLEDRRKAPWVMYSEGYQLLGDDPEKLVSADPRATGSSNGFQRLVWNHNVKLGNAATIQETVEWPKKQLAGLGIAVPKRSMVTNWVFVKALMSDGDVSETKLKEIGISDKTPEVVKFAEARYGFPTYEFTIDHAKRAFKNMMRSYAIQAELLPKPHEVAARIAGRDKKTQAEVEAEIERAIEDAFNSKYKDIVRHFRREHRAQALLASRMLKKLKEMQEDLKKGIPPRGFPGVGQAIAEENGMPGFDAFLGERGPGGERVQRENNFWANFMNQEIRRKYIPWKIERELRAQHPEWNDQRIREEVARLTPGQLRDRVLTHAEIIEALKYHGAPYMGSHWHSIVWSIDPDKRPLQNVLVTRTNHADMMRQIVPDIEQAIAQLEYQFIFLKHNDFWKKYDGSEASYEEGQNNYLRNIVTKANELSRVTDGADDEAEEIEQILDRVVPNLPLMDIVLRIYPQFKRQLCTEQNDRKVTEQRTDIALAVADGVSLAVACVPPLASIGGAAYLVSLGASLVVHTHRAWKRAKEIEDAKAIDLATGPQNEFNQAAVNELYYQEMEGEYAMALVMVGIDVALAVPGIAAKPVRTAVGQGAKGMMSLSASAGLRLLKGGMRYGRRFPGRFVALINPFSKPGQRAAAMSGLNPFTRLGLAYPWRHHPTLWTRLAPHFSWQSGIPIWRRIVGVPWQVSVWAVKDVLGNFPWILLGQRWATTRLARGVQLYMLASGAIGVGLWLGGYFEDRGIQRMTMVMLEHPEAYADLQQEMQRGNISKEEMRMIAELDFELGNAVRAEYEQIAVDIEEQVSRVGADRARDDATVKQLWANLDSAGAALLAKKNEAAKRGTDFRNPEYLMWERMYRQYQMTVGRVRAMQNAR